MTFKLQNLLHFMAQQLLYYSIASARTIATATAIAAACSYDAFILLRPLEPINQKALKRQVHKIERYSLLLCL